MNTNDTLSVWCILKFLYMVTTKPISRLLKGKWLYSKDSFLKNYWLNNFNQTPRNNSNSLSVLPIVSDDFCTNYNEIRKRFSNFLLKNQVPCFVKNAENFVNTRYQNHDFRSVNKLSHGVVLCWLLGSLKFKCYHHLSPQKRVWHKSF